MTLEEFRKDMVNDRPSTGMSVYLQALWWDAKGHWTIAHDLIDQRADKDSARIHAYLHRVEGDEWNSRYWYDRAGMPPCTGSLEEEWLYLFHKFSAIKQ